MLKLEGNFEVFSIETVNKKYEDFRDRITVLATNIKEDGVKERLNKLILDSKNDESLKIISPKKPPAKSGNFVRRNARAKTAKGIERGKPNDINAVDQLKQALLNIDESIKRNNQTIADDLEELAFQDESDDLVRVDESINTLKDFEQTPKKKSSATITSPKRVSLSSSSHGLGSHKLENKGISNDSNINSPNRTSLENSLKLEKDSKKTNESKSTQASIITDEDKENQRITNIHSKISEFINIEAKKINYKASLFKIKDDKEFIDLIIKGLKKISTITNECIVQTEKEGNLFDFSVPDNSIIRGMMKKAVVPKKKEIIKKSDLFTLETSDISIIEEITNTPIINILPSANEEIKESHIEHLYEATEEYKKEFKLQSQLKGLKKVDFEDIQNLWEHVINRRIIEGEKDRISIYLRGYLGTDRYEGEKKKIIDMIEFNKIDEISNSNRSKSVIKPENPNVLANWTKLMKNYINKE